MKSFKSFSVQIPQNSASFQAKHNLYAQRKILNMTFFLDEINLCFSSKGSIEWYIARILPVVQFRLNLYCFSIKRTPCYQHDSSERWLMACQDHLSQWKGSNKNHSLTELFSRKLVSIARHVTNKCLLNNKLWTNTLPTLCKIFVCAKLKQWMSRYYC